MSISLFPYNLEIVKNKTKQKCIFFGGETPYVITVFTSNVDWGNPLHLTYR